MKLTLDLANGANYIIAKNTFEKAGYKITSYNDNPNGKNINDKCGSTYLENLPAQINKDGSSYGISMDGDGDRIAIIDKNNNIYDGDDILYTIIRGKKINNEEVSGVVGTTMTNFALEDYLINEGIDFIRSNVGDKFVLQKMKENNYNIGGETSGHILMLNHSTSGDSIVAALQFLHYSDILRKKNENKILVKYPQKITNIFFNRNLSDNIINIAIKEASDRFLSKKLRVIIRKSGTENCIRIMVEAKENKIVDNMSLQIKNYINDKLKTL
jgi:phosphoglucosamine mutase